MPLPTTQIRGLIDTHKTRASVDKVEWDTYLRWFNSNYFTENEATWPTGAVINGDIGNGYEDGGRSSVNMETNYPYAFIDTMVANVCPSVPAVTINARRKSLQQAAKYREALCNETLKRNKTHEKLWLLSTKASVYPRSFLKAIWNSRRDMPIFRVIDPRFVWYDLSSEEWEDIRYLIEVTVLTKQDFEARIKKTGKKKKGFYDEEISEKANFSSYPAWLRSDTRDQSMYSDAAKEVFQWVVIYEVYDFTGEGRFYHFLENCNDPLMSAELPYKYQRNPFYLMAFNENLVDSGGLSDVKLIANLQRNLNELDTLELWHARACIPVTIINAAVMNDSEAFKSAFLEASSPGDAISVELNAKVPIKDAIGVTPMPSMNPQFDIMRNRVSETIAFTLGLPEYARGQTGTGYVATEFALADAATRTRNGRRQKRVNDAVVWTAQSVMALYEEYLPDDAVLPVRMGFSRDVVDVTREAMRMADTDPEAEETPLVFDFEIVPSSAVENSRLVQLKNIRENFDILQLGMQAGPVDMNALMMRILELLQLTDCAKDETEQVPQEGMSTQMPPEGAPPQIPQQPAPSQDTIAGGGMPVDPTQVPDLPPNMLTSANPGVVLT